MSFAQFLLVLRARWRAALVTFVAVVAVGVALAFLLPKKYAATSSIVVDFKGTDPVLGIMMPAQLVPGYLATQVEIARSHKVAVQAVKRLNLADNPTARDLWRADTQGQGNIEDWLAERLLRDLDADPAKEGALIEITYHGRDPVFAAQVANAFAEAYQAVNLQLRVEPARATATWFDDQISGLKKDLERKQAALSEYQRAKGIHSSDERLDVENAKLNELMAAYTTTQSQSIDLQSRMRQLMEFLGRGADPASLPDVLANVLVQQLKAALAQSEAKLQQISSQLGANHPDVMRLKADIATQRDRLSAEVANVAKSIGNSANIAQKREAELRQAVAVQKERLLNLNVGRDQLSVLVREVDAAQRAYETAYARFNQTNLEGQATQTNLAVLNRAVAPLRPSSPKSLLIVIAAIGLGAFLAVAMALVREAVDRRVRSDEELATFFEFPLLATLDYAVVPRPSWWRGRFGGGRMRSLGTST